MIEGLSQKLVQWQIAKSIILDKDRSVYEYSYIVMIGEVINILIACVIATVFRYPNLLIFLVAYIPLRTYAGGYHADNSDRCMVFSVITLVIVCIIGKYLLSEDQALFYLSGELAAATVIILLAPVEDHNKPLDKQETKKYRKYAYVILLAEISIAILFYIIEWQEASFMLMLTHIMMAAMLIIGKVKNQRFAKICRQVH